LARELETRRQALVDAQREQLVTTAKERSEIKALNLIAEDTTQNINDRIAAADEAGAKERALFEQRKANAEEELAIVKAQNELADSGEEDRQRQAELEAEVFNLAAESLEMQTTLQNKLNTLKQESINLTRQQLQVEIDLMNETVESMQKRAERQLDIARVQLEVLNKRQGAELQYNQNVVSYAETTEEAIRRLRRETFEDFKNGAELAGHQALEFASMTLDIMGSLNTLFTKDEEKRAKRSFEIGKKLAIVSTIMNTAEAVGSALAKDGTFPGSRFIAAAAAGLAGAAQVVTIKRQQFNAGGGAPPPPPAAPNLTGGTAPGQSPQLDLGFLGAGAGQTGFRSYVIASEVSNSQQANQRINDQASLVG
jgi:DNA polymerase III alpha subunit (gram-positive type)